MPETITMQFCQGGREVLARHVTVPGASGRSLLSWDAAGKL